MERLSRTYYSFSVPQISSLASQKADSIVGVVLIVTALILALVNIAFVPSDVKAFDRRGVALALAAALVAMVYIAIVPIGHGVYRHQKLAIGRVIVGEYVDRLLKEKRLDKSEAPLLQVYARQLLELEVDAGQTPRQILGRLANAVGKALPEDFDFSDVEKQ